MVCSWPLISHSTIRTLSMEKMSIRFRGSFSPATRSVMPTKDSSFMSLTAVAVSSRSLRPEGHMYLCDDDLRTHLTAAECDTCRPGCETASRQSVRIFCPQSAKLVLMTCCQTTLNHI